MGRKFTADELKMHRDRWMATVREHSDVLVRAAQTLTETGPLEALFSEMEFNRTGSHATSRRLNGPMRRGIGYRLHDRFAHALTAC
jgi:hypothetical protein